MRRAAVLAVLTSLSWAACTSPPGSLSGSGQPSPVVSVPAPLAARPSSTAVLSASAAPPAPSAAVPKPGRDHTSAVACASDVDCGWDDPCAPQRCVEPPKQPLACEETTPPPGACLCIEGACTLKPKVAPVTSGPCEVRGCVVDRAGGACVADTGGVAENIRVNPGVNAGPSCDCISPAEGCTFQWFEPVACRSDRDCWVDPAPRRHPVARPKALRGRDFKPCTDGEVAPKCSDRGVCVLGPAYSC